MGNIQENIVKIKHNILNIANYCNADMNKVYKKIFISKTINGDINYLVKIAIIVPNNFEFTDKNDIEKLINEDNNIKYIISIRENEYLAEDKYKVKSKDISDSKNFVLKSQKDIQKDKENSDIVFQIQYYEYNKNQKPKFYADINKKEFNKNENQDDYFEIVNLIKEHLNNKLDKREAFVASLNLEFYALMWDSNFNEPIMVNVLQQHYVLKTINEILIDNINDKKEIREELNSAFMHEFWSRYQYEIDVSQKDDDKIVKRFDVYEQLKPNLDFITDYIYNELFDNHYRIFKRENTGNE